MPLPNEFSPTEHFQDTVRRALNPEIRDWFKDVTEEELDITGPRSSLRTACTHQDADSLVQTVGRMMLFEFLCRKPWRAAGGESLGRPPHAVPRKNKPKLVLIFAEDDTDVEPGYSPVIGEISFRLMDEDGASLTESKLTVLGQKIKTLFGTGSGFLWKKGREMLSYTDWDNGIQFQVLCLSEAEGKRVIEQVLDIRSKTPDWSLAELKKNLEESQAYPTIPPTQQILGKSRRLARRRPRANVRFNHAYIEIAGLPNKIYLYDHSGLIDEAIVKR
jgi:hypothetical protein